MSNKIDPESVNLGKDSSAFFAEYLPADSSTIPAYCELPAALELDVQPIPLLPLNEACIFQFPDVVPLPPVYNPPNIRLNPCETLEANVNFKTCSSTKDSRLTLTTGGPMETAEHGPGTCTLNLDAFFCVDACESFEATTQILFDEALAESSLHIVSRDTPNCGIDIVGDFRFKGCAEYIVNNDIHFNKAIKGSSLKISTIPAPDCGINLVGDLTVDACESFRADVDISIRGDKVVTRNDWQVISRSTPDCGISLIGDVEINACADFTVDGSVRLAGPHWKAGSSLSLTARNAPDCGLSILGDLAIDACKDFKATSSVNIRGAKPGLVEGGLVIETRNAPDCGIDLSGDIVIDACHEMNLDVDVVGSGELTFYDSAGGTIGVVNIGPTLSITNGIDGCSKVIRLTLPDSSIVLPQQTTINATATTVKTGCAYSVVYGRIATNYIGRPSSPCCNDGCNSYVDLCNSLSNIRQTYTDQIYPSLCKQSSSSAYIDLSKGEAQLTSLSLSESISLSSKGGACSLAIAPTGLTVGKSNIACDYISIGNVTLTADTVAVGKAYLTSSQLDLGTTQVKDGSISVGTASLTADKLDLGASGELTIGSSSFSETTFKMQSGSTIEVNNTTIADDYIKIDDTGSGSTSIGAAQVKLENGTESITMTYSSLTVTSGGNTVEISVPEGRSASFKQVTICEDGNSKMAYILMTEPEFA